MMNAPNSEPQVIFQADSSCMHALKKHRDDVISVCQRHMNRFVRIQTVDGQQIEGRITHVDHTHVYVQVAWEGTYSRQPFFPYPYNPYAAVLPLVLYNLLVISLLY